MTTIIGTGEVGALHSREELEEMQRLPLQRKIQITTARIIEWYQHYDGKVYVAFSGGKDSTVLLDIVRRIYPDVPAVFSSVLYCHEEAAYEEILQGNWSSTYYCNYGKREQISACHMVAYGM